MPLRHFPLQTLGGGACPCGTVHAWVGGAPLWHSKLSARGGGEGGFSAQRIRRGVWVKKPWHARFRYSHDVSREQALQREVVIETKPSRDGLVE